MRTDAPAPAPAVPSPSASASVRLGFDPVARASAPAAFLALVRRDLAVLRRNLKEFIPRTVIQPLLLVFVFTYVFPKIGQGVGGRGGGGAFSTLLVAGVVALSIQFQGIQAVALPLVQEFGWTREIEDRVLAPLPVAWLAVEKIVAGAIQGMIAAAIVFPVAYVVPVDPVHLRVHWVLLVTLLPMAAFMASALGLTFGTTFSPRTVPSLFGIVVLPLTFLGAVYYPWSVLGPVKAFGVPWLKDLCLANPLVYMSEGFRAALTTGVPHMPLAAIYGMIAVFAALFTFLGTAGFRRRVVS